MAIPFRKAPRVRETTSSTGNGTTINLDLGPTPQHNSFVSGLLVAFGDTNPGDQAETPYALLSGNGSDWEVGTGTVTAGTPNTFSRDNVEASTNSGARISLTGISKIFVYSEAMDGFFENFIVSREGTAKIQLNNFIAGIVGSYADFASAGANGTIRSPTYLLDGQRLGGHTFYGWDETDQSWKIGGSVIVEALGDWTHTARGTRMHINVNPITVIADEWNAAYNSHFTITTATTATTNVNSTNEAIIGTTTHNSGIRYFELHCGSSGADFCFGIAELAHLNNVQIGFQSGGTTKSLGLKCGVGAIGDWRLGGVSTASGSSSGPNNEWIGILLDLDNGYALWRKTVAPTIWYGNNSALGDPNNMSVHGFPFTPFGSPVAIAFSSNQNGIAESTIMNAGGTAFGAPLPSVATAWADGSGAHNTITVDDGLSIGGLSSMGFGAFNALSIYANGVLVSDGSGPIGSVTSVASGTGLTGGPITTSGTLSVDISVIATKAYVDALLPDFELKNPVHVATTTALLFTPSYSNGSSGVGATLTGTAGVLIIDGYTPAIGNSILVKNEAAPERNGVYTLTTLGTIFVGYILTRRTDFNSAATIVYGDTVFVLNGTANQNQQFTMSNTAAITVGTTAINFAQTSGGSQLTSGNGILITGNSIALAMMAAHTFKGNNTGSTANVIDLTATQLTAELNAFIGDSGSGGTKGLVPAPAAGDAAAAKYLSAGGGYSVPTGTGISAISGATDAGIASPAEDDILVYISSKWTNKRAKYVLAPSVADVLTDGQQILYHKFPKSVTFPANFGSYLGLSSKAGGTANATASTVINIDKAANATPNTFSNIGTITIAASGITPTFATSGGTDISFVAGDVIRVMGPATADATFAGFYATLVGYET